MFKKTIVLAMVAFFFATTNMVYAEQTGMSFMEAPREATTSIPFEAFLNPDVCIWETPEELYVCIQRALDMPNSEGIVKIPETPYLLTVLPELEEQIKNSNGKYGIQRGEMFDNNTEIMYVVVVWENY